ncbi:AT-rich interactive domain-containing protein 3C [Bombina bombina]|uniref:AT-rich interactive domain-containing protein 3C n=1 Tax=Bombina bombina TaxID=8345 RepID=UPI00235A758E|nr:AT-rich interactive domain-containing protein 3C [Bombina bombina]
MVDNTSLASKSALATFSSSPTLPSLLVSTSSHHNSHFSVSRPSQPSQTVPTSGASGGMRLEAVMENLQRQQAARLALEEKLRQEKDRELRCMVESRIQQQALAIRHYQAAVRAAAAAVVTSPSISNSTNTTTTSSPVSQNRPSLILSQTPIRRTVEEEPKARSEEEEEGDYLEGEMDDEMIEEDEDDEKMISHIQHPGSPIKGVSRIGNPQAPNTPIPGQSQTLSPTGHHEWTYEEQFKQLYELDDDPKRKEFLDDLFSYMQKRGTPVNRIPIMAKQVLDLYMLYRLVTEKGGLVEVINKKIWREITKGLSLPTSITSAAFTLRTQYMKYLYPYECEKRGLSSPGELQAAIDSNRREGRRQSFGSGLFSYSPVGTPNILTSPKLGMSQLPVSAHNGGHSNHISTIKREDSMHHSGTPHRIALPVSLPGHHAAAAQAVAMQAAALEQLREKLESGEPPEKKMALMSEEQQRIMQHALQQNLLAMAAQLPMNIKISNRDDRQETAMNLSATGISSVNMSIDINGVVYAGVLFARRPGPPSSSSTNSSSNNALSSPVPEQNKPPTSSSQAHTPPSSSP